jgi:nucleoside-diphosphate-sugar epimerase
MLLGRLVAEYEIRTIYHLASILSTKAEYNPETAHRVNVEGTLNLLRLAVEQAAWQGRRSSSCTLLPSPRTAFPLWI